MIDESPGTINQCMTIYNCLLAMKQITDSLVVEETIMRVILWTRKVATGVSPCQSLASISHSSVPVPDSVLNPCWTRAQRYAVFWSGGGCGGGGVWWWWWWWWWCRGWGGAEPGLNDQSLRCEQNSVLMNVFVIAQVEDPQADSCRSKSKQTLTQTKQTKEQTNK